MNIIPTSETEVFIRQNGGYGTHDNHHNHDNQNMITSFHSSETSATPMYIHDLKSSMQSTLATSITMIQQSLRPFPASIRDMGGTSSLSNEMFNLVKNLVGAGAFGIPSGVATLAGGSSTKWAMLPAAEIIIIMAVIFGYYFILLGRICKMTMAASYREAWDRSAGTRCDLMRNLSFLVPLSVILMAGLGNVAYSMILADTVKSLAERFGYHFSRTASLMTLTVFVLLPLCMVKKLSVLAPFSAVGTAGMVFTLVVMAVRCFDGSYNPQQGGRYLDVRFCLLCSLCCFAKMNCYRWYYRSEYIRRLLTFTHTSVMTTCLQSAQTYSFYLACASRHFSVTTMHPDITLNCN
mmetsp:Transcript_4081/g.8434  ORF Transcript_4081/g.8434 Transcript_4081/m.8434 type:complete len:350 (+) Transcript_4081:138-1187(+)